MSSRRRGLKFWISAWLPVAVGIAIIVTESTQYFGADRTSGPFRWLFQAILGPVSDAHWQVIHHLIRKTGHFLGYGLIGLAWLRAWRMTLPSVRFFTQAALALLGTGLLATWDEWHQSFLPNRTSSPWDVLIDCCGAFVLLSIAWIVIGRFSSAPSTQLS
ncbi:MAG: VanZ family protein [Terracidiphilus sp.]